MSVQVPKGYKQTEVGVIPEDWTISPIGDVATTGSGTTPSRALYERYFKNGNINWVKTLDLNNSAIKTTDEQVTEFALSETSLKIYPVNTVLIAMYGGFNQIGRTGVLAVPACVNQALTAVKVGSKINSKYLLYTLNYKNEYWKSVASSSRKDPNITSKDIKDFLLAFPCPQEQQAIAEALSDADALIESLEQLIAKKRQIKQGAMQDLLTGQRRLPGFSGGWIQQRLGDIAHIKTGGRNNQDKVENGEFPFFVRSATVERINTFAYDCEAILVPGEGGIGSIFHYIFGKFDVHQRVYAITQFAGNVSGKFIYYYMKTYFGQHAMENSVKATVDSLRLPTFQEFVVKLPSSLEEQIEIASLLSEMEQELEILEERLQKAQTIKQAMMQELLTGRIRLI